jgi:tetratricopeptide (TPR) repeat protein
MDVDDLLERYEATGVEDVFVEAKRRYEQALAEAADAELLRDYGYLLYCHGSRAIRQAAEQYERAIELDPEAEKAHHQLIAAKAALREMDEVIPLFERRLAAAPEDVRWHRLLASAYLAANEHERAAATIDAGLALDPDDKALLGQRGEVKAAAGDVEGALADWRLSLDPDGHDISGAYSSAFLLEREGRLEGATQAWSYILEYNESRGYALQAEWPRRELERLRARLAERLGSSYQRVHQIVDLATGKGAVKASTVGAKCSFCGAQREHVRKLIAGPGIFICEACVDLAAEVMDEHAERTNKRTRLIAVDATSAKARCSFCGQRRERVEALVEAPDRPPAGKFGRRSGAVRICDDCLALCGEILSEQSAV